MNGLAKAALDYFIAFIFPAEGIDADYAEQVWQSFPEYVVAMDDAQRDALSTAARNRIAYLKRGPDEHGYDAGLDAPAGLLDFLELVASGEIYEQWSAG